MGEKSRAIEQQASLAQGGTSPRGAARPPGDIQIIKGSSREIISQMSPPRELHTPTQSPLPRAVRSNAHAVPHYK